MIDLHSHILPGIDDGAANLDDSLAMANQSVESGVTHMMCTPHIMQGTYDNDIKSISAAVGLLIEGLRLENCPLKISYSAEIRITPEIVQWIGNNQIPYLGKWNGKNVLLLELPHSHIPAGTENLLRWLIKNDVQPVIAHPERNRDIIAEFSRIDILRRCGCLFQVTAGSIIGRFSERVNYTTMKMLEKDLITYVASDTHSISRRPNDMGLAKQRLIQEVGEEKTDQLVRSIPQKITQSCQWQ